MLQITFQANLKSAEKLSTFLTEIRDKVIQNGLDETLKKAVEQLKDELRRLIDTKDQKLDNERLELEEQEKEVLYSATEEAALKYLTGADMSKYNGAAGFSEYLDAKLAVVNYHHRDNLNKTHVGVKFKIDAGDMDTDFRIVANGLNEATFMFIDPSGSKRYLQNPGLDVGKFLKVVCTRDTGITDKSKTRHEHWKDKGGYVEWSLTREGLEYIKQHFIDITPTIQAMAQGDFDHAITTLRANATSQTDADKLEKLEQKLINLRARDNLPPSAKVFSNVVTLIANLKIQKLLKNGGELVNYHLVSSYNDEVHNPEFINFFEEFQNQVNMWIAVNEMPWFAVILDKTAAIIKKYES
jgi:hypothetical protein